MMQNFEYLEELARQAQRELPSATRPQAMTEPIAAGSNTKHGGAHTDDESESVTSNIRNMDRNNFTFPVRLHYMLCEIEKEGQDHIVSWQPHGKCFRVHDRERFVDEILPKWFKQSRYSSFQRQLNIYGFKRISTGLDRCGYWHPNFIKSNRELTQCIDRVKIKGTGRRQPSTPENEPDFYVDYVPPPAKNAAASRENPVANSMNTASFTPSPLSSLAVTGHSARQAILLNEARSRLQVPAMLDSASFPMLSKRGSAADALFPQDSLLGAATRSTLSQWESMLMSPPPQVRAEEERNLLIRRILDATSNPLQQASLPYHQMPYGLRNPATFNDSAANRLTRLQILAEVQQTMNAMSDPCL